MQNYNKFIFIKLIIKFKNNNPFIFIYNLSFNYLYIFLISLSGLYKHFKNI